MVVVTRLLAVVRGRAVVAVGAVVEVAVAVSVPARSVRVGDQRSLAAAAGVVGVDKVGAAVIPVQVSSQ